MKDDLEALFFSSWTGGGGSGFAAASKVPVLEGSTFFLLKSQRRIQTQSAIYEFTTISESGGGSRGAATCEVKEDMGGGYNPESEQNRTEKVESKEADQWWGAQTNMHTYEDW